MEKISIQIISSLIFVFSSSLLLVGQERVIQGSITTFDSIPLIGVTINVKSTKEVVYSDTLGLFTVSCLPKDKLKLTAKGFINQNVKITEGINYVLVNLKLKPGPESADIAIGYGHVKDKDRLNAMVSLHAKSTDFSQYSSIYDLIASRFPTIQFQGSDIIVSSRQQTLTGSNAALLVVDGFVVDGSTFATISPADIYSINIIKDGTASTYGARGANGVVIIETKRGGE